MLILIDTGILLRLLQPTDPHHPMVRRALRTLRGRGETLVTSAQNAAEFWNVCTRPVGARGGLGPSIADADRRLRILERLFPVLHELPSAYPIWRDLVVTHAVRGVQAHDARLDALMLAREIDRIPTFNVADFTRYAGVAPLDPASLSAP